MHSGAYGRVRGGGGGPSNAPRLVIGFALVMAIAAFLSWSTSPPSPPPSTKRLASNSGLVRGTIGQAENMGNILGAASADVVAYAKAAALQDPSANAGAGKGINEGAADITDGMAVFDSSSARGAGPLPAEASAAAAKISGSSTERSAAGGLAGIADAVAAGQAGGFQSASNAGSGQQDVAQAKQSGAASLQAGSSGVAASGASAVKEQAADILAKDGAIAGALQATVADGSKTVGSAVQGSTGSKAGAGGGSGVTDNSASGSKAVDTADTDYTDVADSTEDVDGIDAVQEKASGAAANKVASGAAAGSKGVAGTAGSKAGGVAFGSDTMAAGSSKAGTAAEESAGSKTSPENELVLQNVAAGSGGAAKLAGISGQAGGSRRPTDGADAALA